MTKNLGTLERWLRVLAGNALLLCGGLAPLDLSWRLGLLVLPGLYVLGTAAFATCLGYQLLGISSCATPTRRVEAPR